MSDMNEISKEGLLKKFGKMIAKDWNDKVGKFRPDGRLYGNADDLLYILFNWEKFAKAYGFGKKPTVKSTIPPKPKQLELPLKTPVDSQWELPLDKTYKNEGVSTVKLSESKKILEEIVREETFKSNELEGPYTVYVKSGRLAGQVVMAKKHKVTGIYYYLNPNTGHDELIGGESSVQVSKPKMEGVGYVHDKDIKKDPKHISGERWRIKFQSDDDLEKHGNTEKSPVSEIKQSDLKKIIKELIDEMWVGFEQSEEKEQRDFMDHEKESVELQTENKNMNKKRLVKLICESIQEEVGEDTTSQLYNNLILF